MFFISAESVSVHYDLLHCSLYLYNMIYVCSCYLSLYHSITRPHAYHIDFGIYGFFSDTISQVFFPPGGEHNLVYSYLVFGGGECEYIGD